MPALDGVRALAVTAVLVYHLGWGWVPGGYLGVDVFFVLSGYLITTLLLSERLRSGSVSLTHFYFRRARRLLPALYVVLVVTVAYCALVLPEELARLRGDVVAALAYVTNWFLIAHQESYFEELGRPDLMRHLWSLAVEEQFYLLWPLLLILLLGKAKRVRIVTTLRWTLVAIVASTVLMAVLYDPFADPSRVYYGTDTRAATLLVGAAAAMTWRPWQEGAGRAAPSAVRLLDGLGLGAFAGLVVFFLLAPDNASWMYRGGFLVVAILSVLLVAVVVHPSARVVPRFFGASVLVWIGLRSYAIYLWHWPVFMVTRPEDVPLDGFALDALRLGVTVGLAALSFRLVEDPVRHGALGQWFRGLRTLPPGERSRARGSTAVALVGIGSLLVVCAAGLVQAKPSDDSDIAVDHGPAPQISLSSDPGGSGDPAATPEASGSSSPAGSPSPPSSGSPSVRPSAATGPPFAPPIRVGLFGDSTGMTLALNEPAGLDDYLTISDETVEGCSVLAERIVSSTGFRRDLGSECADWRQKWEDKAATLDPQIALVNLGAWDVFDLEVEGATVPFGTPEWDSYFKGQLKLAIKTLVDSGAQVALVDVPCFRPVAAGGLPLLPERGDDERTRHLNDLMHTVGANYPGRVFAVTPPREFCKDPAIATDLGYRWDGTHYYKPGAKLYFDVVTPQLLAIPSPA